MIQTILPIDTRVSNIEGETNAAESINFACRRKKTKDFIYFVMESLLE